MPKTLKFTIPGEPIPKARPRVLKSGHTYTPSRTKEYEEVVKLYCKDAISRTDCDPSAYDGLLKVRISQFYKIPKNASKIKRQQMVDGDIKPLKRPDIDNVTKAVLDSLNGIAYKDDSQVCELHAYKSYAEVPCVMVAIEYEKVNIGGTNGA